MDKRLRSLVLVSMLAGCGEGGLYFGLAGERALADRPVPSTDGVITNDQYTGETSTSDATDAEPLPDQPPADLSDNGTLPDQPLADATDAMEMADTHDASDAATEEASIVDAADVLVPEDRLAVIDADVSMLADATDVPPAPDVLPDVPVADTVDVVMVTDHVDVQPDLPRDTGVDVGMDVVDAPPDVPVDIASADVRDVPEEEAPPPERVRILFNHAASGVPFFTQMYGTYETMPTGTGFAWYTPFCEGGIHRVAYEGSGTADWSECFTTPPPTHGAWFLFAAQGYCQTDACDTSTFRYFRFEYQGAVYLGTDARHFEFAFGAGPMVPGDAGTTFQSGLRFYLRP